MVNHHEDKVIFQDIEHRLQETILYGYCQQDLIMSLP